MKSKLDKFIDFLYEDYDVSEEDQKKDYRFS